MVKGLWPRGVDSGVGVNHMWKWTDSPLGCCKVNILEQVDIEFISIYTDIIIK